MKSGRGGAGKLGPLEYQGLYKDPQISGRHLPLEGVIAYLVKRQKEVRAILLYF
jgi:hypothetical protein